jgi:hypothetical protein
MSRISVVTVLAMAAFAFASEAQTAQSPARVALEQMSAAERANSRISVEFESADNGAVLLGHEVERLWNGGQFDEALVQLGNLEARVGHVAIGNSWRKPVPTRETGLWGHDARIGNRDSLLDLAVDADYSGHLFAALHHSHGPEWYSVCWSADRGATWVETFTWLGSQVTTLDAAVNSNYFFYVAYYSPGEDAQQVRLRRFLDSDGSADEFSNGAMWVAACTLDVGDTAREVSFVSSNTSWLYIPTLVSDGSVRLSWDTDDDESWVRLSTGIDSGASRGLDGAWASMGGTSLLLSYLDATDTLRILGGSSMGFTQRLAHFCGPSEQTSISGSNDRVICAYEDGTFSPKRVCYALSHDSGVTWTTGTLSDTSVAAEAPAVAQYRGGFGAVFRHSSPTPELRFCLCPDSGPWSEPVSIADNEPWSARPVIKCISQYIIYQVWGVGYLSDSGPVVRGAYFNVGRTSGLAEQRPLASSRAFPATVVRNVLFLYEATSLKPQAASLLDISGRKVMSLRPGANDVSKLAPGVYFVREAQAQAQAQAIRKIVIAR